MTRRWIVCGMMAAALMGLAALTSARGAIPRWDGELHEKMEAINTAMRSLFRAAADPEQRDDALKLVSELQMNFVEAKSLVPPSAEQVSTGERPAFLLDYRKRMCEVLKELTEIELLIIADKNADAVTRIKENLIKMRDEAHDKFQVDD